MTLLRAGTGPFYGGGTVNTTHNIPRITSTLMTWDIAMNDDYGMWDTAAKTRLTTPSWATLVRYGTSIQWNPDGGNQYRHVWTHKNGSPPHGRGSDQTQTHWSAPLAVVGGTDYFSTVCYHNDVTSIQPIQNSTAVWGCIVVLGTT